ncbi:MAG: imidazolonepropionase [Sphingomonadales bacterium]
MARWDTLWINARIATMVKGEVPYGLIEKGAIGVKDGLITFVGPMENLGPTEESDAETIFELEGELITPGLIDCHTHIVFGGNRADEFENRLSGMSYEDISKAGGGIKSTVRATRSSGENSLLNSAIERARYFTAGGVTTMEVKSGYGLTLVDEIKMLRVARQLEESLPLRIKTTFLGAHALPEEYSEDRAGYISLLVHDIMPKIAENGHADAVDAFCEGIGFTPKEVTQVFEKAADLGLPVKLHADQLSNLGGAKLAAEYNALSADHLEYTDENGVKAMASSGTVGVILPGAYYSLGGGQKPPIDLMRQNNVPMAIASDCNPGSSPALSLRLMMNMACNLFGLTPEESLEGVTINAAKALGINKEVGTLEAGKAGDLAIWDLGSPAELSYWIGGNPLTEVVFAGNPLFTEE